MLTFSADASGWIAAAGSCGRHECRAGSARRFGCWMSDAMTVDEVVCMYRPLSFGWGVSLLYLRRRSLEEPQRLVISSAQHHMQRLAKLADHL